MKGHKINIRLVKNQKDNENSNILKYPFDIIADCKIGRKEYHIIEYDVFDLLCKKIDIQYKYFIIISSFIKNPNLKFQFKVFTNALQMGYTYSITPI